MGANFSTINQQRVTTTRSDRNEEINDLFVSNQTDQDHDDQLISSFLEIAVDQTVETARKFLQTTNWNIEEAINLFLMNSYDDSSMYHDNQVAAPRSEETGESSPVSSLCHPPLDLLFEGSFEDAKSVSVEDNRWLIVNLQSRTEFDSHTLNRDVWSNEAVSQTVESSFILWQVYDHTIEGQKISSFYKIESAPPVVLVIDPITGQKMRMWSGVIEAHSFLEDLMKFTDPGPHEHIASLTRNRPPMETFSSRNNTDQVVAPSWGEEFEEEDTYSSRNRTGHIVDPSSGHEFEEPAEVKEDKTCLSRNYTDHVVAPSWGEEFEEGKTLISYQKEEETCSSSNHTDHIVAPSWGQEFEVEEEEETCLEFPDLTEEPKVDCDRSVVCSLCVRFADGRRKQRRFLKSEPIQLLWSFCYSHMEGSERKAFKLVQAIPGASKTLDYGDNATFDQSGLANSMISVTWE